MSDGKTIQLNANFLLQRKDGQDWYALSWTDEQGKDHTTSFHRRLEGCIDEFAEMEGQRLNKPKTKVLAHRQEIIAHAREIINNYVSASKSRQVE